MNKLSLQLNKSEMGTTVAAKLLGLAKGSISLLDIICPKKD